MKFECEHCGAIIHLDSDKVCSRCGAPFKDNKAYIKYKEEKENNKKNTKKALKTIGMIWGGHAIFVSIFFLICFGLIIGFSIWGFKSYNNTKNKINNDISNIKDIIPSDNKEKVKDTETTVKINETAKMNQYDMTLDEVREYKYDWYEKDPFKKDDLVYYAFHLVVNNKANKSLYLNKFVVTYTDDKGNENITAKEHAPNENEKAYALSKTVEASYSASGYIFYELPKYVTSVKIHYGDYLTIETELKK